MKILAVGAALALIALPASAQTARDSTTQQFVQKVAIRDMFEVESGKLAQEKSGNDAIKQFARKMVEDHTKTTNELKSIAQKIQGLELPSQMDAEHQGKLDQLRAASGTQFDQRYRTQQIEAHQKAVQLFQDYAARGDNAELKSWAEKTLPNLREHLQQAQALPQVQAPVAGAQPKDGQKGQAGQGERGGRQWTPLAAPGPNQILASELRGKRVYGADNENVGDINDVLLERNGRVVAVIVGVGGFLGIGEKDVAIPFEALEIVPEQQRDGYGTTGADRTTGAGSAQPQQGVLKAERIVLRGMSKADLEAAPRFRAEGNPDRSDGTPPRTSPQR
jgi:putative membrane protein